MDPSPRRPGDQTLASLTGAIAVCSAVPLLLLVFGVTSVLVLVLGAFVAGIAAIIITMACAALIARLAGPTEDAPTAFDDPSMS